MGFSNRVGMFLSVVCLASSLAWGAESKSVPGQIIIRFNEVVSLATAKERIQSNGLVFVRELVPSMGMYLAKSPTTRNLKTLVDKLSVQDDIRYAQEDHVVSLREVKPDDLDFSDQWNMKNGGTTADIRATSAWELGKGGKDREGNDLVVAIVDGGVDLNHKDLRVNLWTNLQEIPGNQLDDDGNGYIDDVNGWNAIDSNGMISPDSHGTHVAGIVGAEGNNGLQVSGVNWRVKLMAVQAASNTTSVIAAGYGYVIAQKKLFIESKGAKGANVVSTNSSFGVDLADCKSGSYPVWNDLYEAMGKVGILSAAATANANYNVDTQGDVPTSCGSDYLVTVTNTDSRDKKYSSAAYGFTTVDLAAPGTSILSTTPGDTTGTKTGTSMSTPHVAGAIAFLHSVASSDFQSLVNQDPAKGALALKTVLLSSVDKLQALEGKTVSGGRLNLAAAANAISRFKTR